MLRGNTWDSKPYFEGPYVSRLLHQFLQSSVVSGGGVPLQNEAPVLSFLPRLHHLNTSSCAAFNQSERHFITDNKPTFIICCMLCGRQSCTDALHCGTIRLNQTRLLMCCNYSWFTSACDHLPDKSDFSVFSSPSVGWYDDQNTEICH